MQELHFNNRKIIKRSCSARDAGQTYDVCFNLLKVSPLQRHRVYNIIEALAGVNCRLTIFGSSVKGTCTPFSDLDVAVTTEEYNESYFYEISRKISESYIDFEYDNNELDILYANGLKEDSPFRTAIENGVIVKDFYEYEEVK